MYPAYHNHAFEGALMRCFNDGIKENAGVFSQPQGWVILAESLLGRGNRAYEYWKEAAPASYNDTAEKRVLEPYVHGQFIEGRQSPFAGRAHVHWLTGTASTVMVGSVEGILGLRPEMKGIVINPSVPSEWKGFELTKTFRGKKLNVKVNNPNGSQSGVKSVTVNGSKIDGLLIEESVLKDVNDIVVEM
jgi:cellobiose phosphorylase